MPKYLRRYEAFVTSNGRTGIFGAKKKIVDFFVVRDNVMGAGEFFAREGVGDGDNGHVGSAGSFDAGRGVFDDATLFGRDIEEFGGAEEDVGSGFAFGDVLNTDNCLEVTTEIFE